MIRRIIIITLTLFLLLTPSFAEAKSIENNISVLANSIEIHFPDTLVFYLEAQSSTDIVDVRLHYQVDKMNYAKVTSEGWPVFTPATTIKTSWAWDMRKASLPPRATVTYWWTIAVGTPRNCPI